MCKGRKTGKKLVWILSDGGTKRERERVGETETERKKERVERMTDAVITSLIIEHFMIPILSLLFLNSLGQERFVLSIQGERGFHSLRKSKEWKGGWCNTKWLMF